MAFRVLIQTNAMLCDDMPTGHTTLTLGRPVLNPNSTFLIQKEARQMYLAQLSGTDTFSRRQLCQCWFVTL